MDTPVEQGVVEGLATTVTVLEKFSDFIGAHAPKVLGALLVFLIGWFAIKFILRLTDRLIKRLNLDQTLLSFIHSVIKVLILVLLIITCAGIIGIPTASIVTVIGAAGVAISLALQSSLSNVASGLMILINKPFALEDFIEINGVSGKVAQIGLSYTKLFTLDNKVIFIPNSEVSTQKIINYSAEDLRRLDMTFSISYEDNMSKARSVIVDVIDNAPWTLQEPVEPFVRVCAYQDHSIDFVCRVWVKTEDYFTLEFYLLEEVKKAFDRENISIPYPQMDLRIVTNNSSTNAVLK